MPKLSIILPAYNAEKFLNATIDAVEAQTCSDWELVLVDDGSKDATPALCDARAAADARIRVIHQPNGGLSAARNAGMAAAAGDSFVFLDADDSPEPEMYEKLLTAMEEGGCDCACCGYVKTWDSGAREGVPAPLPGGCHDTEAIQNAIVLPLLQDRLRNGFFTGMVWRYVFSAKTLRENGIIFTDAYLEDELFLIRYFSRPCRLASVDEGLYNYYQGNGESITRHYFPGFAENYRNILAVKASLVEEFSIPVRPDWKDNCAWAGLLAAVGNEFAPGNAVSGSEHRKNLRALCAEEEFAHALRCYVPEGMNPRKTLVAKLLRRRQFGALTLLYAAKNRGRN